MLFLKVRAGALLLVILSLLSASVAAAQETPPQPVYTDTWAVQIAPGTDVDALAAQLGFEVVMPIGSLPDYYLLRAPTVSGRARNLSRSLRQSSGILYAEQQVVLDRFTRTPEDDPLFLNQWHLNNTGQNNGVPGADAKVTGAWSAGIQGKGL